MSLKRFNKTQAFFGFFKSKENIIFFIGMFFIFICSFVSVYAVNKSYNSSEEKYYNIKSDNKKLYNSSYTNINERITNLENNFLDKTYPVGSIYISATDSTVESVQTRLGGTWEKIERKFLLSASSSYAAGSTGGSADAVLVSHTHTFTGTAVTSGGPNKNPTYKFTGTRTTTEGGGGHSHTFPVHATGSEAMGFGLKSSSSFFQDRALVTGGTYTSTEQANHSHYYTPSGSVAISGNSDHTHSVTAKGSNSTEGVSGSGKNMPPYLSVYMYKRIS